MTIVVLHCPWQDYADRCLEAIKEAELAVWAAESAQSATSQLFRDPDSIGLVWMRDAYDAARYVDQARMALVKNCIFILLHGRAAPNEQASARASVLAAGADDVQQDSLQVEEISARLKAIARRGEYRDHLRVNLPTGATYTHANGNIETADGQIVHLTVTEGSLLVEMARRPGLTLSKQQVMDVLYGDKDEPDIKIVDVWVYKLRTKIAQATGGLDCIRTVWGRGWLFEPEGFWPELRKVRRRSAE